mmetsp:Transcript_33094/g.87503  ORF Transcript_33094/g.87503 Transcript_33094/m.87503 type:complete len:130 (+) Transcript_33094:475-864(+)
MLSMPTSKGFAAGGRSWSVQKYRGFSIRRRVAQVRRLLQEYPLQECPQRKRPLQEGLLQQSHLQERLRVLEVRMPTALRVQLFRGCPRLLQLVNATIRMTTLLAGTNKWRCPGKCGWIGCFWNIVDDGS